jgi:uncharacterized delta-60 repeat protein
MKKTTILLTIVVMTLFTTELSAQPGSLDTGFDADGIVTTPIGSSDDVVLSIAVQPDEKIVVAGYSNNGADDDFALARYHSSGILDSSFSDDGIVVLDLDTNNEGATSVAIQTDGKIVAAGYHYNGSNFDFAILRYNADGTPDPTFNSNGVVLTSVGPGDDYARSLFIQPDGKIVVAGPVWNGADYDFALARYNTNGGLDNTFGIAGIIITDFGSGDDFANSLRVLPDGRFIVAGSAYNGTDKDIALASYTQSGTLAISFGNNGLVTTDLGSGDDMANAVFDILSTGQLMVAGSSENGSDRDFILARYKEDGELDTSFNGVGYVTTAIGNGDDDARTVFPQPDGNFVVSGRTSNGNDLDFALCRYTTEGDLDNTFGTNGVVITDIGTFDDAANSSVIVPGEEIILAGYAGNGSDLDFALAEYYLWTPTSMIDLSGPVNQVWIYPNPVEQEVTLNYNLDAEEEISVNLVDMQGRILKTYVDDEIQTTGNHELTFSLPEGLPAGNYLMTISSHSRRISLKIVK